MKIELPEIYWHGDKERIMSLDFSEFHNQLITGGTDSENKSGFLKLWEYFPDKTQEKFVNYCGNIEGGHNSTVNCVKFSPNQQNFASASDGMIYQKTKLLQYGKLEKGF